MTRNWENIYANLGDVTDCLRDALRTLRKELPRAVPGAARGGPTVDVRANLEQRVQSIQEVIQRLEQDRSDFWVSHSPEVLSARPQPPFMFSVPPVEA